MIVDLDTVGLKGAIDVQSVRRISLQAMPTRGAASSAVLEIKRSFGAQSPSASFTTTQTITLDGTAITEIDVTDTAWLHLVCTTAESGIRVEVEYTTSGPMQGQAFIVDLDATETGVRGTIDAAGSYKTFVLAEAHGDTNSSAFEIKRAVQSGYEAVSFSPAVNLTIDGATITEIDTARTGDLVAVCGTSQASQRLSLWVYRRGEVPVEERVIDGEVFRWDATRGKWLGELRTIAASRNAATSSGDMPLHIGPTAMHTDGRGLCFADDATIVGADVMSTTSFSGTVRLWESTNNLGALMSVSSAEGGSDMGIDFDVTGDVTKSQYPRLNISGGTCTNPFVRVYWRRRAT